MMDKLIEITKAVGDAMSYSIVAATVVQILPPLAALISILWIGFQFYHSPVMVARRARQKEQHGNT